LQVVEQLVECARVDIQVATREGCTVLYRAANFGQDQVRPVFFIAFYSPQYYYYYYY
jgi:hypothetical protein